MSPIHALKAGLPSDRIIIKKEDYLKYHLIIVSLKDLALIN